MTHLMASPADRYSMEIRRLLCHPRTDPDMMRIHSIFAAPPTGLLFDPFKVLHFLMIHDLLLFVK